MIVCSLSATVISMVMEDIQKHPSCNYCGMDRGKFNYSRMVREYEDGTSVGVCSLHCAAIDLALNTDKIPKAIQVGEYEK